MKEPGSTSEDHLSEPEIRTELQATAGDDVATTLAVSPDTATPLPVVQAGTESGQIPLAVTASAVTTLGVDADRESGRIPPAVTADALSTLGVNADPEIGVKPPACNADTVTPLRGETDPESGVAPLPFDADTVTPLAGISDSERGIKSLAFNADTVPPLTKISDAEKGKKSVSFNTDGVTTLAANSDTESIVKPPAVTADIETYSEAAGSANPDNLEGLPSPARQISERGSVSCEDSSFPPPTRLKAKLPALTGVGQSSRKSGDPLPHAVHPGLLPPLSAKEGGVGGGAGRGFDSPLDYKKSPRGSRKIKSRGGTHGGGNSSPRHHHGRPSDSDTDTAAAMTTADAKSDGWRGMDSSSPPSPTSSAEEKKHHHGRKDGGTHGKGGSEEPGEPAAGAVRGVSVKGTALAVVSALEIRHHRRSSATMHTDLLRAFVPDMLINVSIVGVCAFST